ncbi:pyruvate, phosphate dikinase [Pontivivens insulae]|uniref:Pyruvate, phosphate dikinase n=1 Tax=Pontivivens insulae TaxID=1639689 RepID=A0A2R8ACH6_9RHOB|nr:pyruvate, phosphate dikinase [Pontivivens insulae]RED13863.1 pyruvate phosphate dikinase [Pontivivens insulae]SPF29937.1 Pyruvate, phosphate dikinase [Pontivivens insulae]
MMTADFIRIHDVIDPDAATYGARGVRLARMAALGLPVPRGLLLARSFCDKIARDGAAAHFATELDDILAGLGDEVLLSLRAAPEKGEWGGPEALLNIGITNERLPALIERVGEAGAYTLYFRLIEGYGAAVEGLDPDDFETLVADQVKYHAVKSEGDLPLEAHKTLVEEALALYADEAGDPFPQSQREQLIHAMDALVRSWNGVSARILRQSYGAPEDAGLALIVQRMALGVGQGVCGAGLAHMVDERSGAPGLSGRFLPQAQGYDALMGLRTPHLITAAARESARQSGLSLEELLPDAPRALEAHYATISHGLGDAYGVEFTVENGALWVLDAVLSPRSARATVRIATDLVRIGAITREQALLRVEPRALIENLHRQIDPSAPRDVCGHGLPASPGAATGRVTFSPEEAIQLDAQGEAAILVRIETSPEDIRGMHSASGVLTVRGGMTSHAAVIARGLGLPCVVGAGDLRLDQKARAIVTQDGRSFSEGAIITVDGTRGEVLAGAPDMIAPELDGAFELLMSWADQVREIGVRANADTPQDARVARGFAVDGIGLCRTEHMFFHEDRINTMREMILADTVGDRRSALDRLLPMQRDDFVELFSIMRGLPVTIRLLDPPLHEFLPHGRDEMHDLAEAMDVPVTTIIERAKSLSEFNPMLGKRGVRLGITMPEIYDMQARAIFEAAAIVNTRNLEQVEPEIMIPLVSAAREVDVVKARVDEIAAQVMAEREVRLTYRLGIMVETPRAALRARDLAEGSHFFSFGTNDLTQMTYGLSRDDAGRFMRDYVNQGVFAEDPFHSLDVEGVGELLLIAARRGRQINPDLMLGLCGEHGGDPNSIHFCKLAGFDYVSCSPYRAPIARLAAAQATLLSREHTDLPQDDGA